MKKINNKILISGIFLILLLLAVFVFLNKRPEVVYAGEKSDVVNDGTVRTADGMVLWLGGDKGVSNQIRVTNISNKWRDAGDRKDQMVTTQCIENFNLRVECKNTNGGYVLEVKIDKIEITCPKWPQDGLGDRSNVIKMVYKDIKKQNLLQPGSANGKTYQSSGVLVLRIPMHNAKDIDFTIVIGRYNKRWLNLPVKIKIEKSKPEIKINNPKIKPFVPSKKQLGYIFDNGIYYFNEKPNFSLEDAFEVRTLKYSVEGKNTKTKDGIKKGAKQNYVFNVSKEEYEKKISIQIQGVLGSVSDTLTFVYIPGMTYELNVQDTSAVEKHKEKFYTKHKNLDFKIVGTYINLVSYIQINKIGSKEIERIQQIKKNKFKYTFMSEGEYEIICFNKLGHETKSINIIYDITPPMIKIHNNENTIVTDGGVTNASIRIELTDASLKNEEIEIWEKINGKWVHKQRYNEQAVYFTVFDLTTSSDSSYCYYKFNNGQEYFIKEKYIGIEKLLERLFDIENKKIKTTNYDVSVDYNFIDEDEESLARSGEKLYVWTGEVFNIVESEQTKTISFDTLTYAAVRREKLEKQIKRICHKNIIRSKFNTLYIPANEERVFKLKKMDILQNLSEVVFTIDRIAPHATCDKFKLEFGNKINYINEEKVIVHIKGCDFLNHNGELKNKSFKELILEEEGEHVVSLFDRAGNKTSFTIVIDRTAPNLIGYTYFDKEKNIYFVSDTDKNNIFINDINGYKEVRVGFKNDSEDVVVHKMKEKTLIQQINITMTNKAYDVLESSVQIIAVDQANNKSEILVYFDGKRPDVPLVNGGQKYINKIDNIILKDDGVYSSGLDKITIKQTKSIIHGSLKTHVEEVFIERLKGLQEVTIKENFSLKNGEFEIVVFDKLQNSTSYTFIYFDNNEPYITNRENIKDGFKELVHYQVNLPKYIFKEKGGIYSFKTYQAAFNFAIDMEIKTRAIIKSNGEIIYISISNPAVVYVYKDREEFMNVVEYYAKEYVEERLVFSNDHNQYNIIMNSDFKKDKSALTNQNIRPIKNLDVYRIKKYYQFIENKNILNVPTCIHIRYFNEWKDTLEEMFEIDTERRLIDQTFYNQLKQGFYCVFEDDLANKKEKTIDNADYVIYLDCRTPFVEAEIINGDNTVENKTYDKDFIYNNNKLLGDNALRYVSCKITLIDDMEDQTMAVLVLNGGGFINKTFLASEVEQIPVLSHENGHSGKITVTVYDRNHNVLTFHFIIAGEDPIWRHSDLEDVESDLEMRFMLPDDENVFTEIKIYKYELDEKNIERQNKILLVEDDYGTEISVKHKRYFFKYGGKYEVEYKDIFCRVYKKEAIFFERDLPYASFRNAQGRRLRSNALTNQSVFLTTSDENDIYIYKYSNNGRKKLLKTEYEELKSRPGQKEIKINSFQGITDFEFLIMLVNKENRSVFREYRIHIDAIICDFEIITTKKEKPKEDCVLNNPFIINVFEGGAIVNVKKQGSLYFYYKNNEYIDKDGVYDIAIRDRAGNEKNIRLILDQVVLYDVKATNKKDDVYCSNKEVVIEVLEPIKEISGKVMKVSDGEYLVVEEGNHAITIVDKIGNTAMIKICIDKTSPLFTIKGIDEKTKVAKGSVVFEIEEGAVLKIEHRHKVSILKMKKNIFNQDGDYTYEIIDDVGNKAVGNFKIDQTVLYFSNVHLNNFYTTEDIVVGLREKGTIQVLKNGKDVKAKVSEQKIVLEENGDYNIILKDEVGNKKNLTVKKIPKKSKSLKLYLNTGIRVIDIKYDGRGLLNESLSFSKSGEYSLKVEEKNVGRVAILNFTIDAELPTIAIKKERGKILLGKTNKKDITIKLYKNAKEIKLTKQITKPGKYKIVLSDSLGNINQYEFNLKRSLKKQDILFIVSGVFIILSGLFCILRKRYKFRVA